MLRQDKSSNSHSEVLGLFMTMDVEVGQLSHNDAEELQEAKDKFTHKENYAKAFTEA